ncbi:hypothetical protein [Clostridium intestinale]|uniref:hypothetical protein n=1 Tax=Clostridium intestinale TaxID=36845 RepID=UPI002DD65047|nr:hypothetical protein [Clostridium intestinale]WRY49833.1 hypothetical protein P8F83_14000 [Clostridium intestinale]
MIKKILVAILVIATIICVIFGIKDYQQSKSVDEGKKNLIDEASRIKDDEAYGEEIVISFSVMFKNMVNNKESDLSYLGDIINTNSEAYSVIKNKIKEYRDKNITIDNLDYYIDSVEKIKEDDFKIYVTLDESIRTDTKSEKIKKSIEIKLKLANDKGIYEYKEI